MATIDAPTRHRATAVAMDALVSIEVVSEDPSATVQAAMQRALGWFAAIEGACNRFNSGSEVRQLLAHVGEPVPVSPALFEIVRFSLALARATDGAFDPTVGHLLEARGFNRHYVTGERVHTPIRPGVRVSYRDVLLDPELKAITLRRSLALDLGGVAKGAAIDLAARELSSFEHWCIEAGGDLFAHGRNPRGQPRRVGILDPCDPEGQVYELEVTNQAVCTSGDHERRAAAGHHLVDPRTGRSAGQLASVTVIAPTAMAADGLATAAFILGPEAGRRLLEREGVQGLLVTI